jgi:glycosyltransferase involved in cell wall biosynthesis
MRVCLIAPVPPFRGGIAKYCYSLAKELEKRQDLLLLSYQRQYPELLFGKKSQIDPGVDRAEILGEFKQLSFALDSANPLSWRKTARQIASFAPDMVILPWWVAYWAPLYLYLLKFLKKKNIRVVFLCINVFEHEDSFFKKYLTKLVLKKAESIIVHSELEKQVILQFNPAACVQKHLLPLFAYDASASPSKDSALHLLFFGFVRQYKGLDILLQALALLKDCNLKLNVVGEFWNDKGEHLKLIDDLQIADRVQIVDRYVPDSEMSGYFSRADVVVLPYRKSITSGVIATAYGFKRPVLATNVGGFHEVIQDGYTGKIVEPGDPEALADGIRWFLDHREADFGANISAFAAQKMSWESLVQTIAGVDRG